MHLWRAFLPFEIPGLGLMRKKKLETHSGAGQNRSKAKSEHLGGYY